MLSATKSRDIGVFFLLVTGVAGAWVITEFTKGSPPAKCRVITESECSYEYSPPTAIRRPAWYSAYSALAVERTSLLNLLALIVMCEDLC